MSTGPRPGEGIRSVASNWLYDQITFTETKAREGDDVERTMTVYPNAATVLDRLKANIGNRKERLFRTVNGVTLPDSDRAAAKMVNAALKALCAKVGIDKHVTLRTLRSTWATWHGAVFRDMQETQEVGGWSSIAMVRKHYLATAPRSLQLAILEIWGIDPRHVDRWRLGYRPQDEA